MYFSTAWKHASSWFTLNPFKNLPHLRVSNGTYAENIPLKCFMCTSELYDNNYVLEKPRDSHGRVRYNKIISVCPWCFHSVGNSNGCIHNIYKKISIVKFPTSTRDLIATVEDYDTRQLLKSISNGIIVSSYMVPGKKKKFTYVESDGYIGICDIDTFIKCKLYKRDNIKGKKIYLISNMAFIV
jgi:hypothetical protein